jgi:hypothetical protein
LGLTGILPPPPGASTTKVGTEVLHDFDALGDGRPKMLQPFRQIALVDVIGAHPIGGELVHELSHQRPAVVDACQENRLIAEWDPGIGHPRKGAL